MWGGSEPRQWKQVVAGCTSESKLGQRNSEAQDEGGALSLSVFLSSSVQLGNIADKIGKTVTSSGQT